MKIVLVLILALSAGVSPAAADVFEQARPSDTALRERLIDDRAGFYWHTPGLDHEEKQEPVSDVVSRAASPQVRAAGLRDMDKAFDIYMLEQLRKDRDYKNQISLSHPLLLLEYSSPVLADIVKHYRMSTYERLAIDQARLGDIERETMSGTDRLSRQSERQCLGKNESRGLVAAMRLCQGAQGPFDALSGPASGVSLQDGRRRIHVLAEALARLGFDQARIDKVIEIAGEIVLADRKYEDHLAAVSFDARQAGRHKAFIRAWQKILEKFSASGRAGPAGLEELSLPGVPVTTRTLADLVLLEEARRELVIFKLSSLAAFLQTAREYRQAAGYLRLCLDDPLLPEEFRHIIFGKKDFLADVLEAAQAGRNDLAAYQGLLAGVNDAADNARARLRTRKAPPRESRPLRSVDVLLE
jgi:hypothetical protein